NLTTDQTTSIAFTVRESEIASTIHIPGGQGAVILALETQLPADAQLDIAGGEIIGTASVNGRTTTLVRVTEAGVKLIRITGTGSAQIRLTLAGDLNADGKVDGADSAAWETANQTSQLAQGDLTGDGLIDATDRQVLYANSGFAANQAPVAQTELPTLKTHTDLGMQSILNSIAEDLEGDVLFWRVLSATHGQAKLNADGQTINFTPEPGYSGEAKITLQADDGFAAGAPIELTVNVSDAKLIRIQVPVIGFMLQGNTVMLPVTGDFEDEKGVALVPGYVTFTSTDETIAEVNAQGQVRAKGKGLAVVLAQAKGLDGISSLVVGDNAIEGILRQMILESDEYDVYPGAVTLLENTGQRQIKINATLDGYESTTADGVIYYVENPQVATVDENGLIQAHSAGVTRVAVIWNGLQKNIEVRVVAEPETIGARTVIAEEGAIVNGGNGLLLQIAPMALNADATVSVTALDTDELPLPVVPSENMIYAGAFRLDVGDDKLAVPAQLAMRAPEGAQAGDTVYFYKATTFLDENNQEITVWLAVDSGVVGDDGIIRTASTPYPGITGSGTYIVNVSCNSEDGSVHVSGLSGQMFYNPSTMLAAGPGITGGMISMDIIGLQATQPIGVFSFTYGATYQSIVSLPVGTLPGITVNCADFVPGLPDFLGYANPGISSVEVDISDATTRLRVTGSGFEQANKASCELVLRLTVDGMPHILKTTVGSDNTLTAEFPPTLHLPLAGARLEVVLIVAKHGPDATETLQYASQEAVVIPRQGLTLAVQAHSILIMQDGVQVKEITKDNNGNPLNLVGFRVDPAAFTSNGRSAFVAGADGVIYAIDTATLSIYATFKVPNAGPSTQITSVAVARDYLFVALGSRNGNTQGGLYRFDINQLSDQQSTQGYGYGNTPPGTLRITSTELDAAPNGFYDLAAAMQGRFLVLTAPESKFALYPKGGDVGNLLIVDLDSIDNVTGKASTVVVVEDKDFDGITPQFIEAGGSQNELILSSEQNLAQGVYTLKLMIDKQTGALTNTVVTQLPTMGTDSYVNNIYWQVISQAAGVVVYTDPQGKQYAFVADYNTQFERQIQNSAYETDQYLNLIAHRTGIGGKIGVIKDPFGKPVFLGATSPIAGALLNSLAITPDGKLLASMLVTSGSQGYMMYDIAKLIECAELSYKAGTTYRSPIDGDGKPSGRSIYELSDRILGGYVYGVESQVEICKIDITDDGLSNYVFDDYKKPILPTFRWEVSDTSYRSGVTVPETEFYISVYGPDEGLFPGSSNDSLGNRNSSTQLPNDLFNALPQVGDDPNVRDSYTGRVLSVKVQGRYDPDKGKICYEYTLTERQALTASQDYYIGVRYERADDGSPITKWNKVTSPTLKGKEGEFAAVTLLIHGYQPANEDGSVYSTKSYLLAQQMAERTGGALFVYQPKTGGWEAKPDTKGVKRFTDSKEARDAGVPIFLVADWYSQSGISTQGFAEAAADALYASLVQLDNKVGGALQKAPMHIIGHSRGASIASEVAQRMGLYGWDQKADLQVTLLDVHDFYQRSLDWGQLKNGELGDPDAVYWKNIDFLDNYYEQQASKNGHLLINTEPEKNWLFNPDGRSMLEQIGGYTYRVSTANINFSLDSLPGFDKNESLKDLFTAGPHGRVQDWYFGTAILNAISTDGKDSTPQIWRNFTQTLNYLSVDDQYNWIPWYVSRSQEDAKLDRNNLASLVAYGTYNDGLQTSQISFEGVGEGWFYSVLGGGYKFRPEIKDATKKVELTKDYDGDKPERPVAG
ncbi:MAG: hypothetical protein LBU38_03330, partial [Propionibacteriaceae bacterium]|nr:hypothetical protein [Propionibacteriaceae bacterium]